MRIFAPWRSFYPSAAALLFLCAGALHAQPVRIPGPIDDTKPVELAANAPFPAGSQYDQGPVSPSFPLDYVTLCMMPTAAQQKALAKLLSAQQDRSSPQYHHWLTPEQYADRFGLNPADIAKIAAWLEAQGFTVKYQARGRNWIAFSGTAAQIAAAFHTEIHRYIVDGQQHFANAANPYLPSALAGIVVSIRGLNDFHPRPVARQRVKPAYTDSMGNHELAPGDIATIYEIYPLYDNGITGAGQTIVVVGASGIYGADITEFRALFGLPNQPQQSYPNCSAGSLCLILTGTNPGINSDALGEADLDLEWTGAVAPNATIVYAYSTDAFDSAYYVIDNDLGPILSMSYGVCEADYAMVGVSLAYAQSMAQEANAVGITWLAASGDTGAAGCDAKNATEATQGLAVLAPASIPEVTAVGGTEFTLFDDGYWSTTNGPDGISALSYIPEMGWNDTLYGTDLNSTLAGTGGGVSTYFATPPWQTGPGFPNDGGRDVPDIALTAAADHDPYIVCTNGSCPGPTLQQGFSEIGGTSASTPVFAGIIALLNQYLVSNGYEAQPGLGNINPSLYALAQSSAARVAFNDTTQGSNVVPCVLGTPDCSFGYFGYSAGPGYDQVTGWGSVNAYYFVTTWPSAPFYYTLTVTGSGQGTVNSTDGQINCASGSGSCSAIYSSGTTVTLNAAPAAGYSFTGWSGPCTGGNPCVIVMNSNVYPSAAFAQNPVLTVTELGQGTVTSTDGQINCTDGAGTCSASYTSGTKVTLNATPAAGQSFLGWSSPCTGTSSCMLTLTSNVSINATFTAPVVALQFIPVAPCRIADTRNPDGPFGGPELSNNSRSFPIPTSACHIPSNALAYSLNVTAVPSGSLYYLTIWPTGQPQPVVSTLNSTNGIIKADAAIVPAGGNGSVSVYANGTSNVVLDINGYFVSGDSSALAFYPVTPCRLVDSQSGRPPWRTDPECRPDSRFPPAHQLLPQHPCRCAGLFAKLYRGAHRPTGLSVHLAHRTTTAGSLYFERALRTHHR